ncbi:pyridoxal phosphate-dependent aminotransferase [Bacteroides faecichinchillae]|uniref:MalY/PatB family protein n=1 Tax=Bacteroides faecichinchillae TaxID=871325 RepID=UPI0010A617FF|nr:MalY/PatB family protein [Bacteroides faecichinchillae]THG69219.1 pyridoxal phosphate-dependent aminotransferase [Bacteroides faecichinchillae]
MKCNFDEIIPRRGTNSYKWDTTKEENVLPMWVADMDFRAAPVIVEALRRRVEHGIFGYASVPDTYYEAIINWFDRRHAWQIEKEWIIYTTGVVPALSAIIKALTSPQDKVLVQTPVYNCFFSSIRNNGCEVITNPLIYRDGTYQIDFSDLEKKSADPSMKFLLLCNPHNPVGRVWTKRELNRIGEICLRNDVWVIADEIHCELVYPGYIYTPFASISPEFLMRSVTCVSPSKAFNLAGLQIANIVCANADLRIKIDKAININEVCDVNPFGIEALIAAYNEGKEWLEELKYYLWINYNYLKAYFSENLPQFPVTMLEGTYLVWVDCSVLKRSSIEIVHTLLAEEKLQVNNGSLYGKNGEGFIRINIACPRQVLIEGLNRLKRVLISHIG